jgi:recombination protein RecT
MSSTAALRTAATAHTEVAKAEKPKTIAGLLTDPIVKQQMQLALPKHVTADRLARIALTEVRKNPQLARCEQASFLGALMQCCALGLEPGGALGHCYLIPFKNTRKNITEVQFIVGYRGMIDLARRSGQIVSLEARAVYAKDHFEVELGLDSKIVHKPAWDVDDRGPLAFVYAVAKLRDGGVQFEVMSRKQIEHVRNESSGYRAEEANAKKYDRKPSSPWHNHFEEMAKKTVVRMLFKYLPVSIEIQRAVGLDEQAEVGMTQDSPLLIEGSFTAAEPETETPPEGEPGQPAITAQEIHDALAAAKDRDSLDAAADLIRMLPEGEHEALDAFYQKRAREFAD